MSSETTSTATKRGGSTAFTPRRRFPEFQHAPAWEPLSLRKASVPVDERVGARKLTPVSISAGIGFVPQAEKFGRDISGNQYQLYTLVRDGDFVFNKGNSLKFPQGCIYLLEGWGQVAAPNVFIAFRLQEGYSNGFFQNCFEQNQHGKQLKRHITSGARSNGLLNISKETFFGIEIPTPSLPEQQKIADCLASADALIEAQRRKVEALKAHKIGLMQQLFPQEGETQPRLRFPEFLGAGEWEFVELGRILKASPDYGVSAAAVPYDVDLPKYLRITDIAENGSYLEESKVSVDIVPTAENYLDEGDIAIARTGASVGKSYRYRRDDGKLVFAGFLIRLRPDQRKLATAYLAQYLTTPQYWDWIAVNSARSGQPGINSAELSSLPVPLPADDRALREQRRIADCLTSLDDLIAAETRKLDGLKTHKKGLMQQLFPILTEIEP